MANSFLATFLSDSLLIGSAALALLVANLCVQLHVGLVSRTLQVVTGDRLSLRQISDWQQTEPLGCFTEINPSSHSFLTYFTVRLHAFLLSKDTVALQDA